MAQAAECSLKFAHRLTGKKVCLACDKGNKKGVGHFVKCLACIDGHTGRVSAEPLDINASGGLSEDCGKAIESSIAKVNGSHQGMFKLNGQTTDSGGGGALDGLAKELKKR